MARRQKTASVVRVNAYAVIARAVEEGVVYGISRAHKHTDHPSREELREAIEQAVLNDLCEVLRFDAEDG